MPEPSARNSWKRIGLGGGCHWCTEGIFRTLTGIGEVQQGWISAAETPDFSEAILADFNPVQIPLAVLADIHLHTYSSTSRHRLRTKYRSALYTFDEAQYGEARACLASPQRSFAQPLVTRVLLFAGFSSSPVVYRDYLYKDATRPFCARFILPRIRLLVEKYAAYTDKAQLGRLPL